MRLTRVGRVGFAFIGAGLLPLACWTVWSLTRTWRLVDMPVSLSQGSHFSTGEFASNLEAEYAIAIDSENKIPFDDLECLLGSRQPALRLLLSESVGRYTAMEQFYKVHQTTPWVTVHQVRPERLLGRLDTSKPERVDAISLIVTCLLTVAVLL